MGEWRISRPLARDAGGLCFEKVIILNVTNLSEVPTALLSTTSFNENIAAGSAVATLSSTDPDAGNAFSCALVTGTGSSDNGEVAISSN